MTSPESSAVTTVRQPVWAGVQPVAGLWLEATRLPATTRVARLLDAWRPGARALRFADGDLLRYAAAVHLDCATLPGEPLCEIAPGVLAGAPLTAQERSDAADADVLLVRGAHVRALRTADAQALDLAPWLALDDYPLHDTFDCMPPPVLPDVARLKGRTLREALGDKAPAPSAERAKFLKALAERQRDRAISGGRRQGSAASGRPLSAAPRWLPGLLGWLAGLGAVGAVGTASGTAGQGGTAGRDVAPRRAPAKPSAWRNALTRLALATRASSLLGWRQAAYLRRLMSMFDDGDLDEALRNALPLDGDLGDAFRQSFGTPGRRDRLQLGGQRAGTVHLDFGDDARTHLRNRYRQAFERLDRQGRIDEAAFVLGELLNARQECVDYLERHGRLAQAADLALGWDLPSATIVRLLVLNDDWERALMVARRDRAFAAAIPALERAHPGVAMKLRAIWAEDLADRGDWLGAVDAIWPVAHARHLAAAWLQIAERGDDLLSVRALVRRAELLEDTLEAQGERIAALIDGVSAAAGDPPDDERDVAARLALAEALLAANTRNPTLSRMAAALLPPLAADAVDGRHRLGKKNFDRLLTLADDPFLKADIPALPGGAGTPARVPIWQRAQPLACAAPPAGLIPVLDVGVLEDGRYLLALGDAGVVVCDRRGRVRQRFTAPATRVVVADGGRIALAVAQRESVSRVTRLDLVRRIETDLGTMRLETHAATFDGVAWTVFADGRILVVDTTKSLRDVLWHVGDLPGPLIAARFGRMHELYLFATSYGPECWMYETASRRLRLREPATLAEGMPLSLRTPAQVLQPERIVPGTDRVHVAWRTHGHAASIDLPAAGTSPESFAGLLFRSVESGVLLGVRDGDDICFTLCRLHSGGAAAEVRWPAATMPAVRESDEHLLLCDAEGRVLHLSLTDGAIAAFSLF